jgi:hypothetical protein
LFLSFFQTLTQWQRDWWKTRATVFGNYEQTQEMVERRKLAIHVQGKEAAHGNSDFYIQDKTSWDIITEHFEYIDFYGVYGMDWFTL